MPDTTATNPKTGQTYRLNPQSNQWEETTPRAQAAAPPAAPGFTDKAFGSVFDRLDPKYGFGGQGGTNAALASSYLRKGSSAETGDIDTQIQDADQQVLSKVAHGEEPTLEDKARQFLLPVAKDSAAVGSSMALSPVGIASTVTGGIAQEAAPLATGGVQGLKTIGAASAPLGRIASAAPAIVSNAAKILTPVAGAGAMAMGANAARDVYNDPSQIKSAAIGLTDVGMRGMDAATGTDLGQTAFNALGGANPEKAQQGIINAGMIGGGAEAVHSAAKVVPGMIRDATFGAAGKGEVPGTGGMTGQQVYAEARKAGVEPGIADASQSKPLKFAKAASESIAGGAGVIENKKAANTQQMAKAMQDFQAEVDPQSANQNVDARGQVIQGELEKGKALARADIAQRMEDLDNTVKTPVQKAAVIGKANQWLNKLNQSGYQTIEDSRAKAILEEVANGGEWSGYAKAHSMLSNLDDNINWKPGGASQFMTTGEAALADVRNTLKEQMQQSANKAGIGDQMKQNFSDYQNYANTFGSNNKLVAAMNAGEPSRALDAVLNGGGSMEMVRAMKQYTPDLIPLLKSELIRRTYDPKGNGVDLQLGKMDQSVRGYKKPFLDELFSPEEQNKLRGLATTGKNMALDVNPSGTAKMSSALAPATVALSGHPGIAAGMIGSAYAGAKAVTSRGIADYAMGYEAPKANPATPASSAAAPGFTQQASPFGVGQSRPSQAAQSGLKTNLLKSNMSSEAGAVKPAALNPLEYLKPYKEPFDLRDNADKMARAAHKSGGFTMDMHGKNLTGKDGFSVGLYPERTETYPFTPGKSFITDTQITSFINKNSDILKNPKANIGGWVDGGKLHLDIVGVVPDMQQAVELGKKYNQTAIYDLKNGRTIETGGTGEVPEGSSVSPELMEWAKGTKFANDDGTPQTLYHGTNAESFDRFKIGNDEASDVPGISVTADPEEAEHYGETVYRVYVKSLKPFDANDPQRMDDYIAAKRKETGQRATQKNVLQWLQKDGYDSIDYSDAMEKDDPDVPAQYGIRVFSPDQIRFAAGDKDKAAAGEDRFAQINEAPKADVVHYSTMGDIKELDPNFAGSSSIQGEERARGASNVYLGDRWKYREADVDRRPFRYGAQLNDSRYYDRETDPQNLIEQARQNVHQKQGDYDPKAIAGEFENILKQKGYSGYKAQGTYASFDKVPVERENIPTDMMRMMSPEEYNSMSRNQGMETKLLDRMGALPSESDLAQAAKAGKAGAFWYDRGNEIFDKMFDMGNRYFDKGDRSKFASFVAATSPQMPVNEAMNMAFKYWKNWVDAGKPTDAPGVLSAIGSMPLESRRMNVAASLMGEDISGKKVTAFRDNLNGVYDRATLDTIMSYVTGGNPADLSANKTLHTAMQVQIRKAARMTGLNPAQVQAAVWSFAQAMLEKIGDGALSGSRGFTPAMEALHSLNTEDLEKGAGQGDLANIILKDKKIGLALDQMGVDKDELKSGIKTALGKTDEIGGTGLERIGRNIENSVRRGRSGILEPGAVDRFAYEPATQDDIQDLKSWNRSWGKPKDGSPAPLKQSHVMSANIANDIGDQLYENNDSETHVMRGADGRIVAAQNIIPARRGQKFDWVNQLTVRPDVHGYGIGDRMMQEAIKSAAARGKGIELSAASGAQPFYEKNGFERKPGTKNEFRLTPENAKER